jgi:hypothetical protein
MVVLLLLAATAGAQTSEPFQTIALGVDVNLVPFIGPGVGAGISGRYKHFGFGAYAATQGISGLAQRLSFEEVGASTSTSLPLLVNVRFRYHLLEGPTGPYAAVDLGGELWSLRSGEQHATMANGFVVPKLGFQWFPFQNVFRTKIYGGLFLGLLVGAIFIITDSRSRMLSDGTTTLRPILFNPELFLGWWW